MRLHKLLLIVSLTLSFVTVNAESSEAKLTCANVKLQTKKIFEGEYKGNPERALVVLAESIVKAYKLTLDNATCFKKKEISDLKIQIRRMKSECETARINEVLWLMQKEVCLTYRPLWKYIKA